jgi:hypothetical protein
MNQIDQQKVLQKGFIIIRKRDISSIKEAGKQTHRIVCKTADQPEWHRFGPDFPSKAARDREMKELLTMNAIIED